MTMTSPLGPDALGIELGADVRVDGDGWLVRSLYVPEGLDGPEGVLQGGLAAGVCMEIARSADSHGAPVTSLDARLHAPTPQERELTSRVRAVDGIARYEVQTFDSDRLLVTGIVELAGHDPTPSVSDLIELATVPLPDAAPDPEFATCVICGQHPRHPIGQRLYPGYASDDRVVTPWIAQEELSRDGEHIHELLVAAALDCPTLWSTMAHLRARGHTAGLLAQYQVRFFASAPVMEPLRTVARMDGADGRKLRARGALVDEEGKVYAMTSAMHVAVPANPVTPTA